MLVVLAASPALAGGGGPWRAVGPLQEGPGEVGIGALTLSPDGASVAGTVWRGGRDFGGAIWRLEDGRRIADLSGTFPLLAPVRFDAAGVYSFAGDGFRRWDRTGGAPRVAAGFGDEVEVNDVLFDPRRANYLVSQQMGPVLVLDGDGVPVARIETDPMRPHEDIALTAGGDKLVVASSGFTLVYPMAALPPGCDAACAPVYEALPGGYGPYEALIAVDRARGWIATLPDVDPARAGQQDGVYRPVAMPTVRLWSQAVEWTSTLPADRELVLESPVLWAEFSADGALLVAVEQSGRLTLWHVAQGALLQELRAPEGDWLTEARFVPRGKALYVNTGLGAARILRIGDGALVQEIPAPNTEVVFAPDGRTMVTSALADGPAVLWRR